jgi:hypothetical protein
VNGTNRNNGTKDNYSKTWHEELQRTNGGDLLQVVGVGSFAQISLGTHGGVIHGYNNRTLTAGSR